MGQILRLAIADRIEELPRLATAVDQFLQRSKIAPDAIHVVQLALDELIANEILWGRHVGECSIQVEATIEPDCVRVAIETEGQPFDPRSVPPPDVQLRPEDRREGGLGLYLVQTLVDELHYEYRDGRNRLEFTLGVR